MDEEKGGAAPKVEPAKELDPVVLGGPTPEQLTIQRSAAIRSLCPAGMETLSAKLVLDGVSLEDARKAFQVELAARSAAVGEPEPPAAIKPAGAEKKLSAISDKAFVNALVG